jgi:hypothetical protein
LQSEARRIPIQGTPGRFSFMRTIIGWLCASLLGSLGWWLGAHVALWMAVVLSAVSGGIGLYYGYRWFDANLG